MIRSESKHFITCDGCKEDLKGHTKDPRGNTRIVTISDKGDSFNGLENRAKNSGWLILEHSDARSHFCPNCWGIGDGNNMYWIRSHGADTDERTQWFRALRDHVKKEGYENRYPVIMLQDWVEYYEAGYTPVKALTEHLKTNDEL